MGQSGKGETVIVTGSRIWIKQSVIYAALDAHAPALVVHGGASRGGDHIAHLWADAHDVDEHTVRAKWRRPDGTLDRGAGFARNIRMLEMYPGCLVLGFPFGKANGTRHCMDNAAARGHKVMMFSPDGGWIIRTPMVTGDLYGERR